jgi:hypothetical protein
VAEVTFQWILTIDNSILDSALTLNPKTFYTLGIPNHFDLKKGSRKKNDFLLKCFWSLAKEMIGVGLVRHNAKKFTDDCGSLISFQSTRN